MAEFLRNYGLCLIPLLVAMDPVGLLPVYISLTERLDLKRRRIVILQAAATALLLALGFMLVGKGVFRVLGIEMPDFLVAGGVILFVFALMDLFGLGRRRSQSEENVGAVPLGTPLMAGPATLATSLLLMGQFGFVPTIAALTTSISVSAAMLLAADRVVRLIGPAGARIASRIAALLLAAYAVMMIRLGVCEIVRAVSTTMPAT